MKAIILAAGRGARLKHMTDVLPKCLAITIKGKTLLEIQLETLRDCGVVNVVVVRGYQAEKITLPNIQYYFNGDYQNNNVLESLFYAERELDGDVVVSYSDIWYEKNILDRLLVSTKDISLGIDTHWRERYSDREEHPIC